MISAKKYHTALLLVSFALLLCGGSARTQEQQSDIAAVITTLIGKVFYQPLNTNAWNEAKKGQFLYEGDSLKSGAASKAAITFVNGIEVRMNENSVFKIEISKTSEKGKGNTISMNNGQVWSRTMHKGSQFDIKTPAATVAIRGSTFDSKTNGKFTGTKCYDGNGWLENEYGKTNLQSGQKATAIGGKSPSNAQSLSDKEKETWQEEVKSKGELQIKLVDSLMPKPDESFKIDISVLNENKEIAETFSGIITLFTNTRGLEFSGDNTNWKDRAMFRLRQGRGIIYAKAQTAGVYIVNAETNEEYTPVFLRVSVMQERSAAAQEANEKTLQLDVTTEDGQTKTLELKFRK